MSQLLVPSAQLEECLRSKRAFDSQAETRAQGNATLAALHSQRAALEARLQALKKKQDELADMVHETTAVIVQESQPVTLQDVQNAQRTALVLEQSQEWKLVCFEQDSATFTILNYPLTFALASDGVTVQQVTTRDNASATSVSALCDFSAMSDAVAGKPLAQVMVAMIPFFP